MITAHPLYRAQSVTLVPHQVCADLDWRPAAADMGLGKTVQAISFLAALLGKKGTAEDALGAGWRAGDSAATTPSGTPRTGRPGKMAG